MANEPLESIKFPGIANTFTVPPVDNTLAVQGAAADAKAVGDEISDLKAELREFGRNKISLYNSTNNVDGKYWNSEGTLIDSPSWTVTEKIAIVSDKEMYYTGISSTGSKPKAVFFDENKEFLSSFTPTIGTGTNKLTVPDNAGYVSFSLPILTANDFHCGQFLLKSQRNQK